MNLPSDTLHRVPVEGARHPYPDPDPPLQVHLRCQPAARPDAADVLYVHGATFPSDLSVFHRFDGRSWADALNEAGFHAWGLDFLGYGRSDRYPAMAGPAEACSPLGRADAACRQLAAAVAHVRRGNGGRAVHLLAHSWGSVPAAQFTIGSPEAVERLVLFGPVAQRDATPVAGPMPGHRCLSLWAQYRRFIEDVPRGCEQVLLERHMEAWGRAYLDTDPQAHERMPPSVQVPLGPAQDVAEHWSGRPLYDPADLSRPLLLVRGEWDSVCDDADAARLLARAGAPVKHDVKLPEGTHLMHLETGRGRLHEAVNRFLVQAP